ncbi:type III-A CRISPR-associated RAMP protein Csm5 [Sphaerochaeta sp. S2]|uniref:type III-A CRISPR-associated RAMP protein Csm5 n=1 Tax=Sphaerochaeta sp. S2 TaxID=2798868 RepID=UPI0018E9D1AA|nr:type III-A CRISPR-associated RAMP protein Csm5 [Sphaerochaeta sp. S2]MBJ2356731.1 type III-A CRISPR-associated RAMP protein Csm5 [Sphaerochaeta sp. S2]
MKKQYEITIQPLTAIHIGTGNSIPLMEYLTAEVIKQERFIVYSQESILQRVVKDPKKIVEYERASNDPSLTSLRKFFLANFQKNKDISHICDLTDGFKTLYDIKSKGNPLDSSLEVFEMYRPAGKMSAVIPGSSFKGALRTAMLNLVMHEWPDEKFYDKNYDDIKRAQQSFAYRDAANIEKRVQKDIMGNDPKNDLFRTFAFGDAAFDPKGSQIVGKIENIARKGDTLVIKGIPIYTEALKGTLMGNSTTGKSRATIDIDLQKVNFGGHRYASMEDLVRACQYFFKREFINEADNFYAEISDSRLKLYKKLYDIITNLDESNKAIFPMRLGRWSQAEFVTFEKIYRMPKVPRDHGYGDTRMVFDYNGQLLPMGWCLCIVKEI